MSTLADVLGSCGIAAALYLFVGPVATMRKIRAAQSSLYFSPIPYFAQIIESSVWVLYACTQLRELRMMFICNVTALLFQAYYIGCFIRFPAAPDAFFSRRRTMLLLAVVLAAVGAFSGAAAVTGFSCEEGEPGACRWLGTLAVVLNIIKYSAPLSVMKRVIDTRSVAYMPIHLTLACLACSLSWGWYGIVVWDVPTMTANGAGLTLAAVQIALYCRYCGSTQPAAPDAPEVPEVEEAKASDSASTGVPEQDSSKEIAPSEEFEEGPAAAVAKGEEPASPTEGGEATIRLDIFPMAR